MTLNINFPALGQPVGVLIHHLRRATATASPLAARGDARPTGGAHGVKRVVDSGEWMVDSRTARGDARPTNRAAVFFFCPHHSANHRHAVNCRGLRLVWLLGASKQLRRVA